MYEKPQMTRETFPTITKKQVDALVELIPLKNPTLLETMEEIRYNAGRQSVVELFKAIYEQQQEDNI